jgi:3-oxoacyl-[acyl-carrier-protein] synthase II
MWEALLSGKSGVDYITLFDPEYYTTKIAAEVKEFDPTDYLDRKQTRHTDRFVHFAIAASFEAAEQAKINLNSDPEDIGVIIGSGIGGLTTLSAQFIELAEKGPSRISPFLIPMMIADSASGQVSIALGMKGPNFCTTSACSSGADAIGVAYEFIKRGDVQAMVTGGSDAAITPIGIAGFTAGALSTRNDEPQKASRPFDAERDGFIMGEGAAVLVLESLDYALNRGANILAEVIGDGATSDAYHITQPSIGGEGGAKAMQIALKKAGIKPEQVDYINAHGTSTPLNDKSETAALKTVFGDHAYRIPISSTKSMMGHLIGAAGAIEAVICVLAIRRGVIPPTMNLTHPDPECDLDYVPNAARQHKVRTALSNSFGFGGHNSVLVFREYNEEIS